MHASLIYNRAERFIKIKIDYIIASTTNKMRVKKRGNQGEEEVNFEEISNRIRELSTGLNVDPALVAKMTIEMLYDGISTEQLDRISAAMAESLKVDRHPDYSTLASRILVSNLHKMTPSRFSECMERHYERLDPRYLEFIRHNAEAIDGMIMHDRDYLFSYLGFITLENTYLLKTSDGRIMDRPQYLFMRVAVAIYADVGLDAIRKCYEGLSQHDYIHATPTLLNACTRSRQLMSCFILSIEDSVEGIMRTAANAARISKYAGGIGFPATMLRCRGSIIKGTGGSASGLPNQLQIFNAVARAYDQGGKRPGAIAVYLEPWHGDIFEFLQLKLNQGDTMRARDLFYGLWVPDLFIKRYLNKQPWSLFSEDTTPGLSDVYDGMEVCKRCGYCDNPAYAKWILGLNGQAAPQDCPHEFEPVDVFTKLYERYESEGRAIRTVSTHEIVDAICLSQQESGTPYVCFKDHINRQSNQKNIGTIKSSNLCTEIMEWSAPDSYACCTLASINLRRFVKDGGFDFERLHEIVRDVVRNLDRVIDLNYYPAEECHNNATRFRPIGLGVQGLADVFMSLRIPYLSKEAEEIDMAIFETIYHAALYESVALARELGPYEKFNGSPASKGLLAFDLWRQNQARIKGPLADYNPISGRYDWDSLKQNIIKYGLRNSLLVAPMPTVSTSFILGNVESFEPIHDNLYTKTSLNGKMTVANMHLLRHLHELGLWNEKLKFDIIDRRGSIMGISSIPTDIQNIYRTVWEMKQKDLMTRAAKRLAFIDQSLSLNIYLPLNDMKYFRGVLLAGWELGLKTGSYYIRTRPAVDALKNNIAEAKQKRAEYVCSGDTCTMCAS